MKCSQVVASELLDRLQSGKTSYSKRKEFLATPLKKSKLAKTESISEKLLHQTTKAMDMSKYLTLTGG
jgi:hypothetical protein